MSTDTTPTPWRIGHASLSGADDGTRFNANMIYDSNGNAVCMVFGLYQNTTASEMEKSTHPEVLKGRTNARLIVQAVNERAQLLAERDALKAALEDCRLFIGRTQNEGMSEDDYDSICAMIGVALAQGRDKPLDR